MKWLKLNKIIILFIVWLLIFSPAFIAKAETLEILDISVENIDGKTVLVKWVTNKESQGKVVYGEAITQLTKYIGIGGSPSKYHEALLANLKPETEYYYQIVIEDTEAPAVNSFIKKFKTIKYFDDVPPQISNISIPYISGTAAVVSWDTNEPSTSRVEYGPDITYKSGVGSNSRVTSHLVIVKNLKPFTQYFMRIYSVDKDNNKSGYSYKEFVTHSDSVDKEDLKIFYLRPSGPADSFIYSKNVVTSFKTNHYAKGSVSVSGKGFKTQVKNLDYGLSHFLIFTDLEPERDYNLTVSMSDILGKTSQEKLSFKTRKISASPDIVPLYDSEVKVLGAEFAYYTPASALYRAIGSPHVYSILNGQRYLIPSPSSFREYGYGWQDVKIIDEKVLLKYPRAKLVKGPSSPAIYYLSYKNDNAVVKIKIPTPSIFRSYPNNSWDKVLTIAEKDLNSYEDAKLVKTKDSPAVYYLENNIKHFVSEAVFKKHGFDSEDIVEVNEKHLAAYQPGAASE